jgi:hypothetical protein
VERRGINLASLSLTPNRSSWHAAQRLVDGEIPSVSLPLLTLNEREKDVSDRPDCESLTGARDRQRQVAAQMAFGHP